MATYLDRTQSAGNRKTFTISAWVKRVNRMGTYTHLFTAGPNPGAWDTLRFDNNDQLAMRINNDSAAVRTNRVFRDINAWYHIVAAIDTTQSTASDRVKLYVNGVQETSLSLTSYPSQNHDCSFNNNSLTLRIGEATWSPGSQYLDGIMSHVHFCDGTALAPTVFGETDSTTGEWKIKTSPSFTPGTNGFTILKDGNTITDQSANSNNFSLASGTLTKTEDNPSNVFCTINPLDNYIANATLTNGNTTVATGSGNPSWNYITSTLGVNTGKYYWEVKDTTNNSSILGFASKLTTASGDQLGESTAQWGVQSNGRFRSAGSDLATTGTFSFGQNDIVGFALDCDNNKIYISVNGVYGNSGNPSTGANGITIASPDAGGGFGWYFPAFGDGNTTSDTYHVNFGNGFFGTTAVASAGTNASGNGIFEYDVPTGYTALSTKGLNL
nr:lectin-like protein [uncultured Mediterranean phage uvMED]BAR15321.1 lectin-like protein [uncultured Mediterranean phage uvMED]